MNQDRREAFLKHLGQTNPFPYLIDVESAEGPFIYAKDGKRYIDMIAGVSVSNIGNRHPVVVKHIKDQLDKHMHVMVYGEFIQDSNLEFSALLHEFLPEKLDCVYPVNSGTEANEAALKLAKRVTARSQLIAFKGSYHGNTHGSLSVSANEKKKSAIQPLLPNIDFIGLNDYADLERITEKTAGVILETIQGDAGVRQADSTYLRALRKRCDETGALLIFDEIQCGMGRSGKMFAFEHSGVIPDILTLGKALGGGLPIGAVVANYKHLNEFSHSPILGHITTFGGNPVITAAACGTLEVFKNEINFNEVERLGAILESYLHEIDEIIEIRRVGMMFACDMKSEERVATIVEKLLQDGIITFWFLSHPNSFRLSPPLNITEALIHEVGKAIQRAVLETK